jgi:mRNA interferase RelE/StbE
MYRVDIREDAAKAIEHLPRKIRDAVYESIAALAQNPRPHGCVKLKFNLPLYRIRVADYRIVYTIKDKNLVVLIIRVAHRREVYRYL